MTEWTIRVSAVLYVAAVAMMIARRGPARAMWTAGCVFYLAHVVSAFHFVHGWSHAAAYRETARQTAELAGVNWGGGLYWNYLFTLVWTVDALWWYARRPRWASAAIHGFMGFVFFNATVVFGHGPIRWVGVAAAAGLGALAVHRLFSR